MYQDLGRKGLGESVRRGVDSGRVQRPQIESTRNDTQFGREGMVAAANREGIGCAPAHGEPVFGVQRVGRGRCKRRQCGD